MANFARQKRPNNFSGREERMELILATRNQGKIRELERMFRALAFDVRILGLDDFPEVGSLSEPGRTFFENALHKASTVCRLTGQPALADDSGLEVDALAGAPGVYSARYSKEGASDVENNRKLLQDLANTPREHRTARFRCQLVACLPGGETLSAEGTWEGWIGFESKGDNGFGYDPLFIDRQTGLTAAQMPAEEKNSKSHRAKALKRFVRAWPEFVRKLEKGKDL